MKIVIAGGQNEVDFLIGSLLEKKHKLVVINQDKAYCEYLAETHQITIINGDPCKQYVLDDAGIKGSDILIALTPNDADNLAICQTAKRIYGVKKVVCTVFSPKNVEVFKKLGVNTVISASNMLACYIEQAFTAESLRKTLSIENEQVI
ncbi:NAD-binding protein [Oscillospiraceae bacterium PP1C4]